MLDSTPAPTGQLQDAASASPGPSHPAPSHVSAQIAQTLALHADEVFGLLGNGNAYFIDALLRTTDLHFTAVRHEAGSVVAADAHYRTSGRMAIATTTYGAGFTNTLTALAESAQAHVPLVLVTGDQPTTGARPWDVDQPELASALGVRTFTVGDADAAKTTQAAVAHARAHSAPVVLAIPYDLVTTQRAGGDADTAGTCDASLPDSNDDTAGPKTADSEAIARLAADLHGAQRPFLLAGRGAWLANAGDQLGRIADATGALTGSSVLGRGVFPNAEFDLGVTGGFGAPGAMDLIGQADVAVVFGAALNQFTMRFGQLFSSDTRVWQIDTADSPTHARVDTFIQADARVAAAALADALADATAAAAADSAATASPAGSLPWRESVDVTAARTQEVGPELAPDGRLDPRALVRRIGELLPAEKFVVSDGGHFIGWANMFWDFDKPSRINLIGTAYQAIGLGWHMVAGAARANQDSTIVLLSGDGGGVMSLSDMDTAVRTAGGRGLALVFNDAAYGAEINLYGLKGLREQPMRIPQIDFAGLATAAGARGVVLESHTDLAALEEWLDTPVDEREFLLLDLRISPDVIAPYQHEVIRVNS